MRYPDGDAVLPVLECADMIRRGVIVQSINFNGAVLNYQSDSMTPPKDYYPVQEGRKTGLKAIKPALSNVGKKVTDLGFSFTAAVGNGLSEFVQSIAPLIEGFEEDEDSPSTSSHPSQFRSPVPGSHAMKRNSKTQPRVKVEYDYEDEPIDSSSDGSKKEKTAIVNPNADPLLGTENIVQRPKKAVENTSAKDIPLNGMGTSYGRLPDTYQDSSVDPLLGSGTPNNALQKKGSKSLFSPNWFPSSSTSSSNVKEKTLKDLEKGSRQSAGVDLNVLQSYSRDKDTKDKEKEKEKEESSNLKVKSKRKHQEHAVGDRLLDLADELIRLSQQNSDESTDLCIATAKRLQGLVDILSGYSSIVDYDTKFGNKALPSITNNRTSLTDQGIGSTTRLSVIDDVAAAVNLASTSDDSNK